MAKLKYTKQELKGQRDALERFERYLPTLRLKKEHLQAEIRSLDGRIRETDGAFSRLQAEVARWSDLFSEEIELTEYVSVDRIRSHEGNVAGVVTPVLDGVDFRTSVPDLFATPPWIDEGVRVVTELTRLNIERMFLSEEKRLLEDELRVTNQRVNLFEKVRIPETRDNIRRIRIALGDRQAAEVARAKIAKGKGQRRAEAA
jgi:V/A-type H+-transporting ATPase subunit D